MEFSCVRAREVNSMQRILVKLLEGYDRTNSSKILRNSEKTTSGFLTLDFTGGQETDADPQSGGVCFPSMLERDGMLLPALQRLVFMSFGKRLQLSQNGMCWTEVPRRGNGLGFVGENATVDCVWTLHTV